MRSYTNLDLSLQFVCFFCNDRLYRDRPNDQKYILQTSKLTGNLLLNTITDVNYMKSVFPQRKIQHSKVTKKTITETMQYQN